MQILKIRDASSGIWVFGKGMDVIYLVVLLYLLRPIAFLLVGILAAAMASHKAG
jgi:hypothetical protein